MKYKSLAAVTALALSTTWFVLSTSDDFTPGTTEIQSVPDANLTMTEADYQEILSLEPAGAGQPLNRMEALERRLTHANDRLEAELKSAQWDMDAPEVKEAINLVMTVEKSRQEAIAEAVESGMMPDNPNHPIR